MDIIFDCPNCEQELAVDQSGAGSEIECPSCGTKITIPGDPAKPPPPGGSSGDLPTQTVPSSINSSAAAKVEMHLKVPVRDKPGESLITKPKPPLEVVVKGAGKKMRIHTIRHASCIESGHDKFDEKVTQFLCEIGETNIISTHIVNYEHFDVGVQKVMTDYGILVIYRG
jgi:DNA-directed RNA polymerase subunit RPC12/RpoP